MQMWTLTYIATKLKKILRNKMFLLCNEVIVYDFGRSFWKYLGWESLSSHLIIVGRYHRSNGF